MTTLETKLEKSEKQREDLFYKNIENLDEIKKLREENQELKVQLRDISWKPSQIQIDIEKLRNPALGKALEHFYGYHHPILGLGLPQRPPNLHH